MTTEKAIAALVAANANAISVANISRVGRVHTFDTGSSISIILDQEVEVMLQDPTTKAWSKQKSNTIYLTQYDLLRLLRQDPEFGSFASRFEKPEQLPLLAMMFAGANITIARQDVKEGDKIVNPFASDDAAAAAKAKPAKHDTILYHLIGGALPERARTMLANALQASLLKTLGL